MNIEPGCIKVGKGPITISLTELRISDVYLYVRLCFGSVFVTVQAGTRRVRTSKVLETVDEVKWN